MNQTRFDDDEQRKLDDQLSTLGNDPERVAVEEQRVRSEFSSKYGKVAAGLLRSRFRMVRDLAVNLVSLYDMLVDPDYVVGWDSKTKVIFALAYFISPVDVIPDAIPVAGFLDDALVVAYVVHRLSTEVAAYRQWRASKGRPLPSA